MSRIRTIKPEFFTSEDIVSLTPLARLFYVSLWCEADREGRLEWKPRTLKMRYLPGDDVDVVPLGDELCSLGLVVLYEVDGKQYAEIPTFKKHQIVNNRESPSKLPPRVSDACPTRESGVPDAYKGKGREGKGDSVVPHSDPPPADSAKSGRPPSEALVRIPLNDGSEYGVTAEFLAELSTAYPAVDVLQQLREMRAWSVAHPANRKTLRGVRAFIVSWLGREQDKGGRGSAGGNVTRPAENQFQGAL